ncbi:MAG: hypothetical protein CBB67_015885 [Alteromonadaceae bacterium TMED7]|nr:hypothetical protein [Alteromonas sp.]RPH16182.1 MAG: hypothetical protein CBB67_015885 [Alteromonadaceae bacterium TMED7]|tara:strand:+ start:918 stop:2396 length:1479 start_codon:yes stop_codon:yes gene_type:complete
MNLVEYPTNTSKWNIVVHQVSQQSAVVWAGTLFENLRKPKLSRLVLFNADTTVTSVDIHLQDWEKPFTRVKQRFMFLHSFSELTANTDYRVKLFVKLEGPGHENSDNWMCARNGYFTTLPEQLPSETEDPFTVALGSCFYEHKDGGRAAASYKSLYERGDPAWQPNIKFLTGDQVYLDIGLDSLSPLTNEVRQRVADDYAKHWQALGSMLSRGGTWMLPDDHEYWNDYPFYDSLLPTLFMLKISKIRNAWRNAAKDGVSRVQQSKPITTFSIDNDISFCIADTRSYRSKTQFIDKKHFDDIADWAAQLNSPGVLVLSQVLLAPNNKTERNLRSFHKQYSQLIKVLAECRHDIVIMTGDVHFGRIASVSLGNYGKKLIEITSSPMSNLTGLNSVATAVGNDSPEKFPPEDIANKLDIPSNNVQHEKHFRVSKTGRAIFSGYLRPRTNEHFMTVSFYRTEQGVNMKAQAWRIRFQNRDELPRPDFKEPFEVWLT